MGKSLKNSPLMQFVTQPAADAPAEPQGAGKAATTANTPAHDNPAPKAPETPEQERQRIASENAQYKAAPLLPPDYRARTEGEARTRRVQLLMRPSLHDALSAIAHRQQTSINHLLEKVLTEYAAADGGNK